MIKAIHRLLLVLLISLVCSVYYYWGYTHGSTTAKKPETQERSSYDPDTIPQPDYLWI